MKPPTVKGRFFLCAVAKGEVFFLPMLTKLRAVELLGTIAGWLQHRHHGRAAGNDETGPLPLQGLEHTLLMFDAFQRRSADRARRQRPTPRRLQSWAMASGFTNRPARKPRKSVRAYSGPGETKHDGPVPGSDAWSRP